MTAMDDDLIRAANRGSAAGVQALLDKGGDVNIKSNKGNTALTAASWKGHREVVQALLDKGAEVNARNSDGVTALFIASHAGHREVVRALLDKGADANAKPSKGSSKLTEASLSSASPAQDESAPLTITVSKDSRTIRYCEGTVDATLNALRTGILQGTLSRDAKTSTKTKTAGGKSTT